MLQLPCLIFDDIGWGSYVEITSCWSQSINIRFIWNTCRKFVQLFLMDGGRQLNSLGPLTWKDCSLSFLMEGDPFRAGTRTSLPLLSLWDADNLQFGTSSFSIFQVYMILKRSHLLTWE